MKLLLHVLQTSGIDKYFEIELSFQHCVPCSVNWNRSSIRRGGWKWAQWHKEHLRRSIQSCSIEWLEKTFDSQKHQKVGSRGWRPWGANYSACEYFGFRNTHSVFIAVLLIIFHFCGMCAVTCSVVCTSLPVTGLLFFLFCSYILSSAQVLLLWSALSLAFTAMFSVRTALSFPQQLSLLGDPIGKELPHLRMGSCSLIFLSLLWETVVMACQTLLLCKV